MNYQENDYEEIEKQEFQEKEINKELNKKELNKELNKKEINIESFRQILKNKNYNNVNENDYFTFINLYSQSKNCFNKVEKQFFFELSMLDSNIELFNLLLEDINISFNDHLFPIIFAGINDNKYIKEYFIKKLIESNKINCDLIYTLNRIEYINQIVIDKSLDKILYKGLKNKKNKEKFKEKILEEKEYIKKFDLIFQFMTKDIRFQILLYSDEFYHTDSEIYFLLE